MALEAELCNRLHTIGTNSKESDSSGLALYCIIREISASKTLLEKDDVLFCVKVADSST